MKIYSYDEVLEYIAENFTYYGEDDLNQLQEDFEGCGFIEKYSPYGNSVGWVKGENYE